MSKCRLLAMPGPIRCCGGPNDCDGSASARRSSSTASGTRIDVLSISESSDNDWGVDRLGRGVLDSGEGVRVPLSGSRSCHYDLRVVYTDTRVEEGMNVNLCSDAQVVFDVPVPA